MKRAFITFAILTAAALIIGSTACRYLPAGPPVVAAVKVVCWGQDPAPIISLIGTSTDMANRGVNDAFVVTMKSGYKVSVRAQTCATAEMSEQDLAAETRPAAPAAATPPVAPAPPAVAAPAPALPKKK